ncbi:MAG TPA: MYXO-CTERM sorting domain-containing protein [Polyangium sp.]|nr:MYXO-CTERM sorting domain-containing protein [Polyangium sp.]
MLRRSFFASLILLSTSAAHAADIPVDPSNYLNVLPSLQPGDRLMLAGGTYTQGLPITNLNGTDAAWITIMGPASGPAATFEGNPCCNTVELVNSSYVAVEHITVDGKGIDGVFGVSAKNGASNVVHHVRIEGCTLIGQNASQQTVGISTKTPTYGWIIRGNVIDGAGTGMYLGNSNYADPFVGGIIEYNLIRNTIGYNLQIKNQNAWPAHPALPNEMAPRTILRHNVFVKDDTPSPDGDRPNVFLGGPPPTGVGSGAVIEAYGNLFVHNPRESLMQATGRVSIHDNIFVDASDVAVLLGPHDGFALLGARVYDNTFYVAKRAVALSAQPAEGDLATGNLVFAEMAFDGPFVGLGTNLVDTAANAATYVNKPSIMLGDMDLYPLAGKVETMPIDPGAFAGDTDFGCDFNGDPRKTFTHRGAYANTGTNPGWKLANERKPEVVCQQSSGAGGGGSSSSTSGSGSSSSGSGEGGAGGMGGGGSDGETTGSCGCRTVTSSSNTSMVFLFGAVALAISRRRR